MLPADILARLTKQPDSRIWGPRFTPVLRRGRGRPSQYSVRDRAVVDAVQHLVAAGYSQRTAFDIVAPMVGRTAKNVESIWRRRGKIDADRRAEFAELQAAAARIAQYRARTLELFRHLFRQTPPA